MILLDYSQIALSNIIVQRLNDESMIRHMILNSIRMYNKKYRDQYGQMVICAYGMNTWRKDYFPLYKAHRRKNREESDQDWNEIFRILHLVRDEIKENLPYKVLHMDGVEADDIIASLAMFTQEFGNDEPVMIVSSDKDFIQLQKFNNVKQYSPIQKKMVTDENPRTYAFNHIMRGDGGDGIPNVLSADDTFVDGDKIQTPLSKKKIQAWLDDYDNLENVMPSQAYRNFQRNKKVIDLEEIPQEVKSKILDKYNSLKPTPNMKALNYLIVNRMNNLVESVGDFHRK